MLLSDSGEQPGGGAPARGVEGEIGMEGGARQHERGPLPAEPLGGHPADGQQEEPREPEEVARADREGEPRAGPDRWHRRHHRVDEGIADPVPLVGERTPGVGVGGVPDAKRRRGLVDVAREDGDAPTGRRVREDER